MKIEIRSMAPGEVAALYGISVGRLNRWLRPFRAGLIRPVGTYNYTSQQVKYIFEKLGTPFDCVDV